ncbi:HAMP domain-containing protein [Cyanobacteria bacterium FACHB-63]|nr:HAMP domain-containing protein [Cyanobacteria bacterium FACHB-63]
MKVPFIKSSVPRISLRLVLVLPFVLQIFGAVGLVGYLSFKNGQQAVNRLADELVEKANHRIDSHLDQYLALPAQLLQINEDALANGEIKLDDFSATERYFWRQAKAFPEVGFVGYSLSTERSSGAGRWLEGVDVILFRALPNGQAYDFLPNNRGGIAKLAQTYTYRTTERSWYQRAATTGKTGWGEVEITSMNQLEGSIPQGEVMLEGMSYYTAIGMTTPIYDNNQKFIGVLNVDLTLGNIGRFLRDLKVSRTGQVMIIERDGSLIGSSMQSQFLHKEQDQVKRFTIFNSPDPLMKAIGENLQQRFSSLTAIQSQQKLALEINGARQYVNVLPWHDEKGLDWLIVVLVPESDFMAQIDQNLRLTVLLCAIATIAAAVLGWWTSRWMVQPILKLSQASEAIAEGKLDQAIQISRIHELHQLGRSFNRMAQQLRDSFAALAKTNEQLEQRVEERTVELRETLHTLRQTQTQLIQTEKMSSLGQIVAGVAHEINNPVNFIHGNLTYLDQYTQSLLELAAIYQKHYPQPDSEVIQVLETIDFEFLNHDLEKVFNSMRTGTRRIQDIVLSLRNFSRLDEAELKAVEIESGIESTLMILQHRLKFTSDRREIKVVKNFAPLPKIECYPGRLNQVLLNLTSNAIDAIEAAPKPDPTIWISTELSDSEQIVITIADNGCGIPEEIQSEIFNPFFTTKPVGQGTGLGLSISYQIVNEQHQGRLWCDSTVGEGTKFVIEIPLNRSSIPLAPTDQSKRVEKHINTG